MSTVVISSTGAVTQVMAIQQTTQVGVPAWSNASQVIVAPVGGITATNVQSALAGLDTAKQGANANLSALAGLTGAADLVPYFTAAGAMAAAAFTSFGRSLVACTTAAAALAALGTDAAGTARPPTAHSQAWSTITSPPTTLAGYGISDAVALTGTANAFTAGQTIDLGTGALPAAIGAGSPNLRFSQADTVGNRQEVISFGVVSALTFTCRNIGGTRAINTGTLTGGRFFNFGGFGHDGTGLITTSNFNFIGMANGNWSGANRGTQLEVDCTLNGSTTIVFGMSLGGTTATDPAPVLTLGSTAGYIAGNGLLQMVGGAGKSYGISIGSNANWYTTTANGAILKTDAALIVASATASTSTTTGAQVVTGGVGIGGDSFIGGKISLSASGTSSANGLTWTDTSIYRSGASTMTFAPAAATDGRWNFTRSTGENFFIQIGSAGYFGTSSATAFALLTNGASAIIIDASQNITLYGQTALNDAINLAAGTTTGSKIATATTQKLGFWGATPVIQQAGAAQAALAAQGQTALTDSTGGTPSTTLAAITAGASYAQADLVAIKNALASIAAELGLVRTDVANHATLLTAIRTALVTTGLIKGAA